MVGRDRVRRQLCPKTWEGRGGWAGSAAALRARWPCQHRTGLSCASQGPGARRALCTAALPGCRAQRIARQCGGHEGGPGQHRTGFSCASQGKAAWRVRVVVRWAGSACGRRRRPRGVWRRQCCGWPFGGGNRTQNGTMVWNEHHRVDGLSEFSPWQQAQCHPGTKPSLLGITCETDCFWVKRPHFQKISPGKWVVCVYI